MTSKDSAENKMPPDAATIEKYQKMLADNPSSKVFAPLADGYRQLGMMKEALELCQKGVREHPDFAGGRIALANIHLDQKNPELAYQELQRARLRSPENLACLNKIAEVSLMLKKPRQALDYYKMLIEHSPTHSKALRAIQKIEAHFAKHPEPDEYKMERLSPLKAEQPTPIKEEPVREQATTKNLERSLSLADAYFSRNEFEKANAILINAEAEFGSLSEIVSRLKALHLRELDPINVPKSRHDIKPMKNRSDMKRQQTIERLQSLMNKFRDLQNNAEEDLKL